MKNMVLFFNVAVVSFKDAIGIECYFRNVRSSRMKQYMKNRDVIFFHILSNVIVIRSKNDVLGFRQQGQMRLRQSDSRRSMVLTIFPGKKVHVKLFKLVQHLHKIVTYVEDDQSSLSPCDIDIRESQIAFLIINRHLGR